MKYFDKLSNRNLIVYCLLPIAYCLINSCTPDLKVPEPSEGNADFHKTIAIGGDYLAGYQDGALYEKGQRLSIPALLAEQFKLVGGSAFNQALMPDINGLGVNTKPWESPFLSPFKLGYKTDCQGITALNPNNHFISLAGASPYLVGIAGNGIQNFAIPFANTADYFNPAFGNSFASGNPNPYYNRIASNPGMCNLYGDAKAQDASFITAWLGMEDIYNYASSGGTSTPIPSSSLFSARLDTILGGLTANGAKGVIATIPDFRSFPYYTLVAWNAAVMNQTQADSLNDVYNLTPSIHFINGSNGFVIFDNTVSAGARQLHNGEYITLSVPIDSMKCNKYGLMISLMNDRYALDSSEVYEIDNAISSYNNVIRQKAAAYNLALVDMYQYFKTVQSGIKWNGADFNATFVTGGFFSLDGYHPNQKGYALIANEFINAINSKYNANIPYTNCVECDGVLFP